MTDPQSIRAGASAMIALPSLLVLLVIFRIWCRRYASKCLVGARVTKHQMTRRVLRGMSWRVALILLLVIPGFLSFGGSSPEEAGRYAGVGIGFAFLAFPIVMLSLWQVARRFSHHAFLSAASEDTALDTPQKQLVGVARVLDSAASQPIRSETRLISATASEAGLRSRRFYPTAVEGVFSAIVVLIVGTLAISLSFSLLRGRPASPHIAESASVALASTPDAGSKPARSRRVVGQDIRCSIAVPTDWRVRELAQDFDIFVSQDERSIIVGVLAEKERFGSSEDVATTIRSRLRDVMTGFDNSAPTSVLLDGRRWNHFVAHGTPQGATAQLTYVIFAHSSEEGTYQILAWTASSLYEKNAGLMREVTSTFRFAE